MTDEEGNKELIRLNIVMSYPVKWREYQIIENFVQNFYDATGPRDFGKRFRYSLEGTTLTMSSDIGFAEEWLQYVGASSKRSGGRSYAGRFGEGFKIAALSSVRDHHLGVDMESRDWTLHVTSMPGVIDGRDVSFLAYELGKRPYREETVLRLSGITKAFADQMDRTMTHFFYEGNRLLGRCLVSTAEYAVYTTVQNSGGEGERGYVFASYENRGSINIPLVICNHTYKPDEDDRDRDWFSGYQIRQCIEVVFANLDPDSSFTVLEYFGKVWNGRDRSRRHTMNWEGALWLLIRNISRDRRLALKFYDKYGKSLIIRDSRTEEPDQNRRAMALEWFRYSAVRHQYRFVTNTFSLLGIKTVCGLCEEMGGYTAERAPEPAEYRRILVLKEAAMEILGDLLILESWPRCRILVNPKAPVAGCTKICGTRGKVNVYGLRVCARAEYVYLQACLLQDLYFSRAFVTYAHELLHEYGSDTSLAFHRALALMNEKILKNVQKFSFYEKKWMDARQAGDNC